MDQYAGSPGHSTYCYAELTASFINFLHYCSPSFGFYGAGKDNKSTQTDNPSGCHPIRTIGASISIISPPIFMPNALSAAIPSIYPGVGQAPNNACVAGGLVIYNS